jgi:small-conductance mechanosensitive channel
MDIWQSLRDFINGNPHISGVIFSAGAIVLAAVAYLLLRKRVHRKHTAAESVRLRRWLLLLGLAVLTVLALTRIWLQPPVGSVWIVRSEAQNVLESIVWTVLAAVIVVLGVRTVRRGLLAEEIEIEARHKIRMSTAWLGATALLIALFFIWAGQIKDMGVFLGIVGAGLALSMGETLLCIAGWLLLIVRRPFDIGDRIEVDGRIGDVISYSVFQTTMLEVGNWVDADQSTGRLLIIPNSMIIRHALYNYTKGFPFIWNEFSAVVTFESDWARAKQIMLSNAQREDKKIENEVEARIAEMQARYAIRYGHLDPIVWTSIAEHGVRLTLRYLTPVRQRRAMIHRLSEAILTEFLKDPGIDFAYPTTRFFRNPEEGKHQTGGPGEMGRGGRDANQ